MANTPGSDNPFPSVLFAEHVDPANPSAGTQRLFVDTDHLLKLRDSAGTVTTFGASGMTNPMTTKGDIILGDTSGVPSRLAAGTSGYVLTAAGAGAFPTWAVVGASTPPSCYETFLTSGVTCVNANSYYTDSTLALTPAAGDYLLIGHLTATAASASGTGVGAQLSSGGSVASNVLTGQTGLADGLEYNAPSNGGGTVSITIMARVTLNGSTVVRLSGNSARGSSDTVIRQTTNASGATANKATSLTALRITSI